MNKTSDFAVASGSMCHLRPFITLLGAMLFSAAALVVFMLSAASSAVAQDKASYEADRQRAFQLTEEGNLLGALPLLEKLAEAKPEDAEVLERLAFALVASAAQQPAPQDRVKVLVRARKLAEKAKQLGNQSEMVQMLLEKIPADLNPDSVKGEPERKRTPAEAALLEGEAAFSKGEMETAIAAYEKAAKLDPKLYEAPLFIGDAYFQLKQIDKAGEAYARAIAIDPDRETAYRYWGNVLMQNDRLKEAREKFIEAIIAEPYNRAPWQYLTEWAKRSNVELVHPRIDVPKNSVQRKDNKTLSITAMPSDKDDGAEAWMWYSMSKATWVTDEGKFKKAYPGEQKYRHNLREETQALSAVIEAVNVGLKENRLKEASLDISIANLLRLHRQGLIEAYVLLAMADEGIAQDFEAYRRDNRDKLRKYLTDYVTAGR